MGSEMCIRDSLLDVMTNAGELKERVEYDALVDTLVSDKLYAEIF